MRQLEKAGRTFLAAHTPLLPGAQQVAFVDVDSMQRRTYGYAKQGSGFGHTEIGGKSVMVRGLNVLMSTVSTPLAVPVVTGYPAAGRQSRNPRAKLRPDLWPVAPFTLHGPTPPAGPVERRALDIVV